MPYESQIASTGWRTGDSFTHHTNTTAMIYVFGMSHTIGMLKAASAEPLAFTFESWAHIASEGRFFDMPTHLGLFPGDCIKVFLASGAIGWQLVADFQTTADGQRQVVAVDGYIQLLHTLAAEQQGNTLVSFVHGNELAGQQIQHATPHDFVVPWRPHEALVPGCQPIPFEVVRRQVQNLIRHTLACLAMARAVLPHMRIVHVLPPPPIASEEQFAQCAQVFLDAIAQYGYTPLSIRLKYYEVMTRLLQEAAPAFQVELLLPPAQAFGDQGALRNELVHDNTHANAAYGAMVAEQLSTLLAE